MEIVTSHNDLNLFPPSFLLFFYTMKFPHFKNTFAYSNPAEFEKVV